MLRPDGIHLMGHTDEMLTMTQYPGRGRNVVYGRAATDARAPPGQSSQRKCSSRRRHSSAKTRLFGLHAISCGRRVTKIDEELGALDNDLLRHMVFSVSLVIPTCVSGRLVLGHGARHDFCFVCLLGSGWFSNHSAGASMSRDGARGPTRQRHGADAQGQRQAGMQARRGKRVYFSRVVTRPLKP